MDSLSCGSELLQQFIIQYESIHSNNAIGFGGDGVEQMMLKD